MNPSGTQDGSHHDEETFPSPTQMTGSNESPAKNPWLKLSPPDQKGAKGEPDVWQISRQPQGSCHSSEKTAETIQREAALLSEEMETVPISVAAVVPLGFERMELDIGILKRVLQILRNTYQAPSPPTSSEPTQGGVIWQIPSSNGEFREADDDEYVAYTLFELDLLEHRKPLT